MYPKGLIAEIPKADPPILDIPTPNVPISKASVAEWSTKKQPADYFKPPSPKKEGKNADDPKIP